MKNSRKFARKIFKILHMNRTQLIDSIKASDPFYEGISFDALTDDDLLVVKLSIEAHDKIMQGLAEKRALEFQKQKVTVLINRQ